MRRWFSWQWINPAWHFLPARAGKVSGHETIIMMIETNSSQRGFSIHAVPICSFFGPFIRTPWSQQRDSVAWKGWQVPKRCSWLQPWLLCLTYPASLLPPAGTSLHHLYWLLLLSASSPGAIIRLCLHWWPSNCPFIPAFVPYNCFLQCSHTSDPLTSLLRILSFLSRLDGAPELLTASTQSGCCHLVVSAPATEPSLCISQGHTRVSSPTLGRREKPQF